MHVLSKKKILFIFHRLHYLKLCLTVAAILYFHPHKNVKFVRDTKITHLIKNHSHHINIRQPSSFWPKQLWHSANQTELLAVMVMLNIGSALKSQILLRSITGTQKQLKKRCWCKFQNAVDDDGRKVLTIARIVIWTRWAKTKESRLLPYLNVW